jgi:hypothetical protein
MNESGVVSSFHVGYFLHLPSRKLPIQITVKKQFFPGWLLSAFAKLKVAFPNTSKKTEFKI